MIFTKQDLNIQSYPHTNAMVTETNSSGWIVTKILVDTGSAFNQMDIDRRLLQPSDTPLSGFGGKRVVGLGKIDLPITLGDSSNPRIEHIAFDVVDMYYSFNVTLGLGFLTNSKQYFIRLLSIYEHSSTIRGYQCVRKSADGQGY